MPGVIIACLLTVSCERPAPQTAPTACSAETTPIVEIQGELYASPLLGEIHTVEGVVTRLKENEGFYLEDGTAAPGNRSRAVFIQQETTENPVRAGQRLQLTGRVEETGSGRDTITSLHEIFGLTVCGESGDLPLTPARLPINPGARESLEGMRLTFQQPFTLTDTYALSRGKATLSQGERLWSPTEIADPGEAASGMEKANRDRTLYSLLPPGTEGAGLPGGTRLQSVTGVMGHEGRYALFMLEPTPAVPVVTPPALTLPPEDGLRVVSSNLHNFFNGDGQGGGFPTPRGAKNGPQLKLQKQRLAAAFGHMKPDLLAVQELENDGYGPHSAAIELQGLLSEATDRPFSVIKPNAARLGQDEITVGLFFNREALESVGPAHVLPGPAFDQLSRQPLAQLFRARHSGTLFLAVVNHLKSKGSCPEDGKNSDQDDGQGCWNPARVAAVRAQLPWLESLAAEAGTSNIMVLGDLNALRREDPVRELQNANYRDVTAELSGLPQYSFVYRGLAGTLDYVFISPALATAARQAQNWHINADWPRDMSLPFPWLGMSDHDPVVVDFVFSQLRTSD